jgi:RNA polymerase sigma-70 factor (ECF subfamily)
MDEAELVQEAKKGDLDAFNRLVLAYQDLAFNVAFRVMGEQAGAADATQEAFISAYKGIRRFRGGSFRSWLLRIVTNACYDELRRRKRKPATSLEALVSEPDPSETEIASSLASRPELPEQAVERSELNHAIQKCLMGLPAEFRVVAILVDVQELNYQEVADAIGKPLGTVKSRLARARLRMRDCLQGYRELLPAAFRLDNEAIK